MANNIKLIEAHVQESLKKLSVSNNVVIDAWTNFETKYSNISIVNQTVQKVKSKKKEGTAELNEPTRTSKWIMFAVAGLVIVLVGYFAWPYVLLLSQSKPAQTVDTVLTLPAQPIVNTPSTVIKTDTVKRDTLISKPQESIQTEVTKPNVMPITNNNTNSIAPVVNRPKREMKKEETPKIENNEVKKTEGEFDFFDKPAADSLRLN